MNRSQNALSATSGGVVVSTLSGTASYTSSAVGLLLHSGAVETVYAGGTAVSTTLYFDAAQLSPPAGPRGMM
jgi:autotransporter passenger strand-loop-strand repeat protein